MKSITELFDVRGRTIVITGGTGILGRQMAAGLASAGANVAVVSRNPSKGADYFREYPSIKAFAADVVKKEELIKAKGEILKSFGRVDF
jgi:gluconate 5-dehydrogenase